MERRRRRREWRHAKTITKGHGRLERRQLTATASIVDYLDWPGARQVARLTRTRRTGAKCQRQITYLVTSLSADHANPARLLELIRAHWAIENRLHYVRDVTCREDACRVRRGSGPQALAALRDTSLTLLRREAPDNIVAVQEELQEDLQEDRHRLLDILLLPRTE